MHRKSQHLVIYGHYMSLSFALFPIADLGVMSLRETGCNIQLSKQVACFWSPWEVLSPHGTHHHICTHAAGLDRSPIDAPINLSLYMWNVQLASRGGHWPWVGVGPCSCSVLGQAGAQPTWAQGSNRGNSGPCHYDPALTGPQHLPALLPSLL